MSQHTVIIVRHAKAQNYSPGTDDKRELSDAGKVQARQLGAALKGYLGSLDDAFISTAVRAQQTWLELASGANLDTGAVRVHVESVIYSGSPTQIWDSAKFQSSGRTSIIVGHEPTISEVANLLLKQSVDTPGPYGMSTGSAVIVEWDRNWNEWHAHCADLAGFERVEPARG